MTDNFQRIRKTKKTHYTLALDRMSDVDRSVIDEKIMNSIQNNDKSGVKRNKDVIQNLTHTIALNRMSYVNRSVIDEKNMNSIQNNGVKRNKDIIQSVTDDLPVDRVITKKKSHQNLLGSDILVKNVINKTNHSNVCDIESNANNNQGGLRNELEMKRVIKKMSSRADSDVIDSSDVVLTNKQTIRRSKEKNFIKQTDFPVLPKKNKRNQNDESAIKQYSPARDSPSNAQWHLNHSGSLSSHSSGLDGGNDDSVLAMDDQDDINLSFIQNTPPLPVRVQGGKVRAIVDNEYEQQKIVELKGSHDALIELLKESPVLHTQADVSIKQSPTQQLPSFHRPDHVNQPHQQTKSRFPTTNDTSTKIERNNEMFLSYLISNDHSRISESNAIDSVRDLGWSYLNYLARDDYDCNVDKAEETEKVDVKEITFGSNSTKEISSFSKSIECVQDLPSYKKQLKSSKKDATDMISSEYSFNDDHILKRQSVSLLEDLMNFNEVMGGNNDFTDKEPKYHDDGTTEVDYVPSSILYYSDTHRHRLKAMDMKERVLRAKMHIIDAIDERPTKLHLRGSRAIQYYLYRTHSKWILTIRLFIIIHLALVLFEPPSNFTDDYPTSFDTYDCRDVPDQTTHDNKYIFNAINCFTTLSDYKKMTRMCICIESAVIFMYLVEIFLSMYATGAHYFFGIGKYALSHANDTMQSQDWFWKVKNAVAYRYFSHVHTQHRERIWEDLRLIAVFLFVLDLTLFASGVSRIRFSKVIRPIMLGHNDRELRRWLYLILSTLPSISGLALLICSFIIVWAVIGVLIFSTLDDYNTEQYRFANFHNFGSACIALYVLSTTSNYPYIMTPAYNSAPGRGSKFFALYFVFFLVIVMFFLCNLSIPYLFQKFKSSHLREATLGRIIERTNLLAAFQILDVDQKGYIEFSQFYKLVYLMRRDLRYSKHGMASVVRPGLAEMLFEELCATSPNKCYVNDFFLVPEVITTKFEKKKKIWTKRIGLPIFMQRGVHQLQLLVESRYLEFFMFGVILANTVILAHYSYDRPVRNETILRFNSYIILVFIIEMFCKLLAIGHSKIWSKWYFRFDVIVVSASAIGLIPYLFFSKEHEIYIYRTAGAIASSIRLLRLMYAVGIFDQLLIVLKILPFVLYSVEVLGMAMYVFSVIGMYKYAGQITFDITDDAYNEMYLTFDNFAGAFFALFQVLTNNNWEQIMYLVMYSSGNVTSTALYFIMFHFIAVSLMLQLLIAIYVQAFETFNQKSMAKSKEESVEAETSDLDEASCEDDEGGEEEMGAEEEHDSDTSSLNHDVRVSRRQNGNGEEESQSMSEDDVHEFDEVSKASKASKTSNVSTSKRQNKLISSGSAFFTTKKKSTHRSVINAITDLENANNVDIEGAPSYLALRRDSSIVPPPQILKSSLSTQLNYNGSNANNPNLSYDVLPSALSADIKNYTFARSRSSDSSGLPNRVSTENKIPQSDFSLCRISENGISRHNSLRRGSVASRLFPSIDMLNHGQVQTQLCGSDDVSPKI